MGDVNTLSMSTPGGIDLLQMMGRNPACVREHLTSNKDKKRRSGNGTRDFAHPK